MGGRESGARRAVWLKRGKFVIQSKVSSVLFGKEGVPSK